MACKQVSRFPESSGIRESAPPHNLPIRLSRFDDISHARQCDHEPPFSHSCFQLVFLFSLPHLSARWLLSCHTARTSTKYVFETPSFGNAVVFRFAHLCLHYLAAFKQPNVSSAANPAHPMHYVQTRHTVYCCLVRC